MNRSALIAAGVLALTLGNLTAATASPATTVANRCRPSTTALPLLDGAIGGQVISGVGDKFLLGGVNLPDGTTLAVSWSKTGSGWTVTDLSDHGRYLGNANGIDRRGEVLIDSGFVLTPDGRYHQLRTFGAPASGMQGRQINQDGVIAGTVFGPAPDYLSLGAVWSNFHAFPRPLRPLPFPDSVDSAVLGINNAGDTVGASDNSHFTDFAGGLWQAGRSRGTLLPGLAGTSHAFPLRINNAREVVGDAANADFSIDGAAEWTPNGQLRYIGDLLPTDTSADFYGLSNDGRAVGTSRSADNVHFRLIYWPGHGPLKTLLPLTKDWINGTANAHYVTDNGTIGGNSSNANDQDVPVVWTCADQQAFTPAARTRSTAGTANSRAPRTAASSSGLTPQSPPGRSPTPAPATTGTPTPSS